VLADEPTGSLDSENAQEIARLLVGTARDRGAALILVTHDRSVAAHADRTLEMHSGRIGPRTPPEPEGGRER
jgi:predicted ABC-type transport system involved in lysophospholipase L1 biosynthesis ATPase subunit